MRKTMMLIGACALGCAALAFDTASAAPKPGPMKGRTGQGRAIRLHLKQDTVRIKAFTIEARCRDGSELIIEEGGFLPTPIARGGRIHDYQYGKTDKVWIRGHLKGRQVRGTIRVTDRWGKVRCNSGWVRFHAARRG
jgi:hypothetical protein